MLRFNPPPGWPAAPNGWVPDPSWRPDPSWPPAPDGWQWMVTVPDPVAQTDSDIPAAIVTSTPTSEWFNGRLIPETSKGSLFGPLRVKDLTYAAPSTGPDQPWAERHRARRQEANSGEKAVFVSPKVWGPIAALVLAFGLIGAYEASQRAGLQSGSDATASAVDPAAGPTASAMGCTDAWTLVKTTNGINIFDCTGTATGDSGHQTLWRFDDAGAQASFMDTMSRAIRPTGHLVFTDKWAVISGSPESFRAAINAGGQDYGS
jgi:hypothetical protein